MKDIPILISYWSENLNYLFIIKSFLPADILFNPFLKQLKCMNFIK